MKTAIAAKGEGLIVYLDYNTNAKTDVPGPIRAMIMDLEGDGLEVVEG